MSLAFPEDEALPASASESFHLFFPVHSSASHDGRDQMPASHEFDSEAQQSTADEMSPR